VAHIGVTRGFYQRSGPLPRVFPTRRRCTAQLGYPLNTIVPIGVLMFAGVAIYLVPRTQVLGAIYLTPGSRRRRRC
jgi:hypothetical protein